MSCGSTDKTRWFYSGNQVGHLNHTGFYNYVSGGQKGLNITSGITAPRVFTGETRRDIWNTGSHKLSQDVLDASVPFMQFNWICDIKLSPEITFRISNKNLYVEDKDGLARFYQARVSNAPTINVGLGEWLSENYEIGEVTLKINNRDGFFNTWLPQGEEYLQWMGGEVSIKVGYGEKLENYFEAFKGFIPAKKGVISTIEELTVKCYEQLQNNDTTIPSRTFDSTNFPFVDPAATGKAIPIIYGDWTEAVSDYGDIPAYCTNALDGDSPYFVFQISENALTNIGDVYLHRGDRVEGKFGPLRLLGNVITKYPSDGRVVIPKGIECLSEPYIIMNATDSGEGSGIDRITAKSSSIDFVKNGVTIGDRVYVDNTSTYGIVDEVRTAELILTGGISFVTGTKYKVATVSYSFRKGDKISLTCVGKKVNVHSINRIADCGLIDSDPSYISISLTNSYWFSDDVAKKLYEVSFENELINEIQYSEVSAALESVNGLAIQVDGSLWIAQELNSTIYRYLVEDRAVGSEIRTLHIEGIYAEMEGIRGLCIDAGNLITFYNRVTGYFYRFNPFGEVPTLVSAFHKDIIDPAITDIRDIDYDANDEHLVIIDGTLGKIFRADPDTGLLIADSGVNLIEDISSKITNPTGIGYSEDKTLYILNRLDNSIYNYNEFDDANFNPAWMARDLIQSYGGKTAYDFDLQWNQVAREILSKYRGRVYIEKAVTCVKAAQELLRSFSTSVYVKHGKFCIFSADFDSFRTNGDIIREGDIIEGQFKPSKEFNQYFNSVIGTYANNPFTGKTVESDNYISPSGVQLSGRELLRKLDMKGVYRRQDVDELVPLFVRLASAEPEFIDTKVGFRFLFTQLNTFFNVNFVDFNLDGQASSGRRFENVPCFVRKIAIDLNKMTIALKLWSLGTTAFSGYNPVGLNSGGYQDEIILTNLGTVGYVAPVGRISGSDEEKIYLNDVDGYTAQERQADSVGKAWEIGYKIIIVSGESHQSLGEFTVAGLDGNAIILDRAPEFTVEETVYNSADLIVGGMYIKYPTYLNGIVTQRDKFAHYGRPIEGYPESTTEEIEEQRAGLHSFEDGRLPYVLHPEDFIKG